MWSGEREKKGLVTWVAWIVHAWGDLGAPDHTTTIMSENATKVLEYILEVVETTGATPTHKDIMRYMGFGSDNTVRHHLRKLAEAGHISPDTHRITLGPRYAVTVHDVATE